MKRFKIGYHGIGVGPFYSKTSQSHIWPAGGTRDLCCDEVDQVPAIRAVCQSSRWGAGSFLSLWLLQTPSRGEDVLPHAWWAGRDGWRRLSKTAGDVSVWLCALSLWPFPGQILKQLARTYADNHATMSNNDTDRCGASFYRTRGIINGALWYSFAGGKMMLPPKKKNNNFLFKVRVHGVMFFVCFFFNKSLKKETKKFRVAPESFFPNGI